MEKRLVFSLVFLAVLSLTFISAESIIDSQSSCEDNVCTLYEGDTLTFDGEDSIFMKYISSTEIRLTLNNKTSNLLGEGDVWKLYDGDRILAAITIEDISFIVEEGGRSSVTFSIDDLLSDSDCEESTCIVPEEEPEDIPEGEDVVCRGCSLDNKCYPLGYRKSGEYCSDSLEFVAQLESDVACENNFECGSNVCVSGQCVSQGLIQKILNWLKNFFS